MRKNVPQSTTNNHYRGRFAPTPSGPLHLGSLVAALGSYLDAKAHAGQWLLRIEDVDKPRAVKGADSTIMRQLDAHGLGWDGHVEYQSQRDEYYHAALKQLSSKLYQCDCSRRQIKQRGECYDGYCRSRQPRSSPYATRFTNDQPITEFYDRWYQHVRATNACVTEDFVVRRRDELFAYQLAVVVDDIDQGITDIVRGSDLVQPSFWQLTLWQQFTSSQPRMMHLPLVTQADGRKLSKQNHAPAIEQRQPIANLSSAMQWLGLTPIATNSVDQLLQQAVEQWRKHWQINE